jgi:Domain of unknown function (DUF1707)
VSTPARWRAGDADREQVAEALRTAHAEGRLGLDEFGQRLDAAFAATYVDELVPLTADLPPASAAVEVVQPARRTRPDRSWQGRPGVWPTSYGGARTPHGRWPAARGCPGRTGLPGGWLGLLVLVAVALSVVAVAAGGAPWPLLWLVVAIVVLRGRSRSGLSRGW